MVEGLLKRGFDVNARDSAGQHGLYLAIRDGSREVIPVLVEHPGLEVDAANTAGETPLMMAARYGSEDGTKLLLRRGADAQLLNEQNLSASDFAKKAGRDGLAKELATAALKAQ